MQSFNPNNGEILWTNEKYEVSGTLEEAGLSNIYQYTRPYGDRLLLLGDENAMLYDGKDGKLLGTAPVAWDDALVKAFQKGEEVPPPVATIGENMVAFFCEETTVGFDLKTGKVVWTVDEVVDRKYGYLTFDKGASHYALFGFKKKSMLLNLDEGKVAWETGEDLAMTPKQVTLQKDGTLLYIGFKGAAMAKIQPFNVQGSFIVAFGLDFATGKPKWGPTALGRSAAGSMTMFGSTPMYVDYEGPWERPDGLLYYIFGFVTRVAEGDYMKEGGEGLVLLDPATGKVKWRTNLTMGDNWGKHVVGLPIKGAGMNYFKAAGGVPMPVFEGDAAYLSANNTVVKVDLNTGKTLWQGPEYTFVYNFQVDKGRVFGPIGYSKWSYAANVAKQSADDVINRSKKVGYFVLDANTGKQVFAIEKAKTPLQIHFEQFDAKTNSVYLCDGEVLRGLNLGTGKYDWELNLEDQLNGEISAEEGVIFKNAGVDVSQSMSVEAGGGFSITTSTTTNYAISMEHRIVWRGDRMLVFAEKGPAMVGLDGKVIWKGEWDWNPAKINFAPTLTDNGIVYQYKSKLTYLSLKDGSIIWQTKEAGSADFAFDPTGTKIFVIEKKNLAAYKL